MLSHVLQDRKAFLRLIGQSALQSLFSAVLAPSLRYVTDQLSLSWRRQLTTAAHKMYLQGNTFYSVAQLGGMRVKLHLHLDLCRNTTSDVKTCMLDESRIM